MEHVAKKPIDKCLTCGDELDTGYECVGCGKDWAFMFKSEGVARLFKADIASPDLNTAGLKNPEQGMGFRKVFALRNKPLPKK